MTTRVERTNPGTTAGSRSSAVCTERTARVIDAFIALANAVIITRRLLAQAWLTHLGQPATTPPRTYPRDL